MDQGYEICGHQTDVNDHARDDEVADDVKAGASAITVGPQLRRGGAHHGRRAAEQVLRAPLWRHFQVR